MQTMKIIKLTIVIFLAIFISSCNKTNIGNYPELIVGGWISTNVTINGLAGNTFNESLDSSAQLFIGEDAEYHRNYVTGSWDLDKSKLTLSPEEFYQMEDWNHEILELTESILKVKIELTKSEFGWGFSQFDEDEILTIIQTYSKQE